MIKENFVDDYSTFVKKINESTVLNESEIDYKQKFYDKPGLTEAKYIVDLLTGKHFNFSRNGNSKKIKDIELFVDKKYYDDIEDNYIVDELEVDGEKYEIVLDFDYYERYGNYITGKSYEYRIYTPEKLTINNKKQIGIMPLKRLVTQAIKEDKLLKPASKPASKKGDISFNIGDIIRYAGNDEEFQIIDVLMNDVIIKSRDTRETLTRSKYQISTNTVSINDELYYKKGTEISRREFENIDKSTREFLRTLNSKSYGSEREAENAADRQHDLRKLGEYW
jgi:hypothetical protein